MRNLLLALIFIVYAAPAVASVSLVEKENFLFEHDPKLLSNTIEFVFRAGSFQDPKGKEGLARLSFLALLRGTEKKSRVQFISELETLGASLDVTTSGGSIMTLNVIKENLIPAMKLTAEAILHPGLRDNELNQLLEEEKAKLAEERNSNRLLARKTFRAFLLKGTVWAHSPEGDLNSIARITADDIRRFLKENLKSGNLVVVAASNRDKTTIQKLVEENLAALPNGPASPRPEIKMPELREGIDLVLVPRKGSATTEAIVGQTGYASTDSDRYALETGMFVFGSDFTSRLTEILRKQNGWTYGAYGLYSMIDRPRRQGGIFTMYAFPQSQFTHLAVPKMAELFADYLKNGVTQKELRFAVNAMSNSYPFEFAEIDVRLNHRLMEILEGTEFPSVAKMRAILKSMTPAKIKAVVEKHHKANHFLAVLVGDPDELEKTKAALKNVVSVTTVQDPMTELPQ